MKKIKSFSLIELLITISILAIVLSALFTLSHKSRIKIKKVIYNLNKRKSVYKALYYIKKYSLNNISKKTKIASNTIFFSYYHPLSNTITIDNIYFYNSNNSFFISNKDNIKIIKNTTVNFHKSTNHKKIYFDLYYYTNKIISSNILW